MEVKKLYDEIQKTWIENGNYKLGEETLDSEKVRLVLKVLRLCLDESIPTPVKEPEIVTLEPTKPKSYVAPVLVANENIVKIYNEVKDQQFRLHDASIILKKDIQYVSSLMKKCLKLKIAMKIKHGVYIFVREPVFSEDAKKAKSRKPRAQQLSAKAKVKLVQDRFGRNTFTSKDIQKELGLSRDSTYLLLRHLVDNNIAKAISKPGGRSGHYEYELLTTGHNGAVIIQDIRDNFRGKKFERKDALQLNYTPQEIQKALTFMIDTDELTFDALTSTYFLSNKREKEQEVLYVEEQKYND